MTSNFFVGFYTDPWDGSDGKREAAFVRPDSQIKNLWLYIRHVPFGGNAEPEGVSIELVSLLPTQFNVSKNGPKLRALMKAVMPSFLDYRTALLELDGTTRSEGDRKANAVLYFRSTWLEHRIKELFEVIKELPLDQIPQAAAAFDADKPQAMLRALNVNGHTLKMFSPEAITPAMCLSAVTTTPSALQHVPGRLLTRTLCQTAIAATKSNGCGPLEHIPLTLRNLAMCKAAITANGIELRYVPPALKTIELCARACVQNGLAWDFVPKELRTPQVEFARALHGFHERDCDQVFEQMHAADPEEAKEAADKYQALFVKMHYPKATADELSDMGISAPSA